MPRLPSPPSPRPGALVRRRHLEHEQPRGLPCPGGDGQLGPRGLEHDVARLDQTLHRPRTLGVAHPAGSAHHCDEDVV
eukprot:scaffold32813_cov129-Isochrysis_galbana.AAC.1